MRLKQLSIKNYRCFGNLTVELHPELTVLIAPNGAGKTTLLDAARTALWPLIKGFDLGSQTGKAANISPMDVRLKKQIDGNMEPQVPSTITATGLWGPDSAEVVWVQTRASMKASTKTLGDTSAKRLTVFAEKLEQQVRDGHAPVTLPLISYLGTSRLWFEERFTSNAADTTLDRNDYSRTSGYLNCLSYSSSFKAFTAWYGWVYRAYLESQIDAFQRNQPLSEIGRRFEQTVEVIKVAVDALVKEATGWHSLEYSHQHNQQLIMRHEQHGIMPVDMLSDGLRNAIAMVADLAFRAIKLNPHLGTQAAQLTHGVVLIDEVDMFLHPSWQQTILKSLRTAFPKVQFIVSTHSPQVLTTVASESIRILHSGNVYAAPAGTEGAEPGRLLTTTLGLESARPPSNDATKELMAYLSLVNQDLWGSPEAEALRTKLDERYQGNEPALLEADLLIENRRWELGEGAE
jgi:predicted ATP-binding protein involved in virulence